MDNRAIKVFSLQFLICTYISTINKTRFYEIRCLRPKGCVFANRVKYGMWDMLKLPFCSKKMKRIHLKLESIQIIDDMFKKIMLQHL